MKVMADVQAAVESALPAVLVLMETMGRSDKPIHFHLHDVHPLSTSSPYGVSDHLSFLGEIPLSIGFRGQRSAPLMFGPQGLARIVGKALEVMGSGGLSFTLEIHPDGGRLALGDALGLFGNWRDQTNAEGMNHWLSVLAQNHRLLLEILAAVADGRELAWENPKPYE